MSSNNPILTPEIRAELEEFFKQMDPEKLEELQSQTYFFRIIASAYHCKSTDINVITDDIYMGFEGELPREQIYDIVKEFLPSLFINEDIFFYGKFTELGIQIAEQHIAMLGLYQTSENIH
jgi:hypothetical protein